MESATAAATAKSLIKHYEVMEDLNVMAMAKAGESRRAHDFIRVDLPLMIDIAEGRNPRERELSERQKALLDMTPKDVEAKIKSDMGSARRVLGWSAPFAKGENKNFVLGQDTYTGTLISGIINHIAEQKDLEFNPDGYKINAESKISKQQFQAILDNEKINMEWPQPGQKVNLANGSEGKKVEAIFLSSPEEESAIYYRQYKVEGEKELLKPSELRDPESPKHGYGVIAEKAGKLYFVQTEGLANPVEPEHMYAREIIGTEKKFISYIERTLSDEDRARQAPIAERDTRWALAMEKETKEITGEFTYRTVDGPNDFHGPIIIRGMSWGSSPDPSEKQWAAEAIERHLQKYEYPSRSIHEEVSKQRMSSLNETNAPRQETVRYNQQAAVAIQNNGHGF